VALWVGVTVVPAATAPARRTVARKPYIRSNRPWPAVMPPVVSLTAADPKYRAAEARLALFIQSLQLGRRARAVDFLSSRVSAPERQALLEKRWLRNDFTSRKDFTQVLFLPDLQVRTAAIRPDRAECYVTPRTAGSKKSKVPVGYLRVPMHFEQGQWRVELHPGKT